MQKFWAVNTKSNSNVAEIFLYGYIDPYDLSAGDFIKELRSLEKDYTNIHVRINSGGGSVFEGLAIYNAIQQSSANIETFIDGLAASMASIIALAGSKCHMSKSAMIMTHQPSVGSYGNSDEHRKNAQLLDGLEATMLSIYAAKTGKKTDECKTNFMNGKDNWFNAQEAKDKGLVDDVYDSAAVEAPKEKADAKIVWGHFNKQQFAAVFNEKLNDNNMKVLSPAALAALNITDNNDQSAIDAAIITMAANSKKADQLQTQLTAANAAKTTAENALQTYKETAATAEIDSLVSAALDGKKITAKLGDQLKKDYAGKPTELKALIDAMPGHTSITAKIEEGKEAGEKMAKMSWEELDNIDGALDELKASNLEMFKAKYKEQFKKDYEGK